MKQFGDLFLVNTEKRSPHKKVLFYCLLDGVNTTFLGSFLFKDQGSSQAHRQDPFDSSHPLWQA
ncbi:hypothetical protein SAMN05444487_104230 [Marininema mesophilum]|uniref:Uncharacterized protein n=1 Tax=Marininema mesophilum TaxID=1048340 RepID=A0A1H2UUK3_9BACL|nr:hypothetical protein SAMN05444487_104230 [Marininema mesophilum]